MHKNFSYIHIEKLKDWGRGKSATRIYRSARYTRNWGSRGCWEHDLRLIETPNANKKRFQNNAIICKETELKILSLRPENVKKTGCDDPDFVSKKAKNLIDSHGISVRDDQVKIAMMMLSVSPQFLRDGIKNGPVNTEKLQKWAHGSNKFLQEKFGDRFLAAVIHMDESNPHMSAYVVPLIEKEVTTRGRRKKSEKDKPKESVKKWCLCAKDIFTPDPYEKRKGKDGKITKVSIGKGTCSILQDEYAVALQQMGLEIRRGVRRAPYQKALEHETNRLRYERLSAPIADIETLNDDELREWAIEAAPQAEEARRAKTERDYYQVTAADAQESVEKLGKIIKESQRSLPVSDVIASLTGMDPRPTNDPDTVQFILANGQKISVHIPTNKFENLTLEIPFESKTTRLRGRGAIDAVCLLTGWNFPQSTAWIADNFDNNAAKVAASEMIQRQIDATKTDDEREIRKNHAQKLLKEMETPDETKWEKAREKLVKSLRIAEPEIDKLHEKGWLKSNKYGHALFTKARWDEQNAIVPTGKIIVDIENPTEVLKETGENGLVQMTAPYATGAILCGSAADALALRSDPQNDKASIYVVGIPSEKTITALGKIIKSFGECVSLAENTSAFGQKLATWIADHFRKIETLPLPKGFQNWLDHHLRPRMEPDKPNLRIGRFPEEKGPGNISSIQ